MISAIILLSTIGILLEVLAFLDLYATLQNHYRALGIAVFLTSFITLNEIWFAVDFSGLLWERELVYGIVSLDIALAALIILHYKSKLKNMLRKKRISVGMKRKWEERKAETTITEGVQDGQTKQEIIEESKDVLPGPTENNT